MTRAIRYLILALPLYLVFATSAAAGELEDDLIKAAMSGHADIVRALIEKGADVNAKNMVDTTALMHAAGSGHAAVVRVLIDKGADVNATNAIGMTALNIAEENGKDDIVHILKGAGAK